MTPHEASDTPPADGPTPRPQGGMGAWGSIALTMGGSPSALEHDLDAGAEQEGVGVVVDHATLYRWIQACASEPDRRLHPHLRMTTGSWRVDSGKLARFTAHNGIFLRFRKNRLANASGNMKSGERNANFGK